MKARVAWVLVGVAALAAAATAAGLPAQEQEREERQEKKEGLAYARVWADAFSQDGRSWLGVHIEEVDRETAERLRLPEVRGARVREVVEESPASEAGLEADDVIVGWNGSRVESAIQLRRLLREMPPGREVRLGVVRDGREREIRATLEERRSHAFQAPRIHMERFLPERHRLEEELADAMRFRGDGGRLFLFSGRGRLGVTLHALGEQLGAYFGVEEGHGALVASVREDSPAAKAGILAGDVIVRVGEKEIEEPSDVAVAVHEAEPGPITITVVREKRRRTLTAELPQAERGFEEGRSFRFEFAPFPDREEWEIRAPVRPDVRVPAPGGAASV